MNGDSQNLYVLTVEEVLVIRYFATGKGDGPRSLPLLESAISAPLYTYDGAELYPDIFSKAGAYLRSLAENQPFVDGNKRTAWASALAFLNANGYAIIATVPEAVNLMLALAAKEIGVNDAALFFVHHAVAKN